MAAITATGYAKRITHDHFTEKTKLFFEEMGQPLLQLDLTAETKTTDSSGAVLSLAEFVGRVTMSSKTALPITITHNGIQAFQIQSG